MENNTNTNRPTNLTCACGTEWETARLMDGHTRWNTAECLDCFLARTKAGRRGEAQVNNAVRAAAATRRNAAAMNPGYEVRDASDAVRDARACRA